MEYERWKNGKYILWIDLHKFFGYWQLHPIWSPFVCWIILGLIWLWCVFVDTFNISVIEARHPQHQNGRIIKLRRIWRNYTWYGSPYQRRANLFHLKKKKLRKFVNPHFEFDASTFRNIEDVDFSITHWISIWDHTYSNWLSIVDQTH